MRKDVVENQAVSHEAARAIYGVVIGDDEPLDVEGTRAQRRDALLRDIELAMR